jgi:hypothetical protein
MKRANRREVHPTAARCEVKLCASLLTPYGTDPSLLATPWTGTLQYSDEDEKIELTLASGSWYTLDFERCDQGDSSAMEVLDATSQDLAVFMELFDRDRSLRDKFEEAGAYLGLLICDRISVPEEHRGRKFGLLLQSLVIEELGGITRLPVCTPAAFEVPPDSPERAAADRCNARLWKAFGFKQHTKEVFWIPSMLQTVASHNVRRYSEAVDKAAPITVVV